MPVVIEELLELLELEVPQREIARMLGVASPTIDYHVAKLRREAAASPHAELPRPELASAVTKVPTHERVRELLELGYTRAAVARQLGVSKATVSYHAQRLGKPVDERGARRYDWGAVQRYYDEGHSVSECQEAFGFSRYSWHMAVKRGAVVARPTSMPIDELCVAGTPRSRFYVKRRLIAAGLKEERCERCGLDSWRGRPLTMALHHVNGDRHDNRLENLELLCPNCHAQTENFAGRNRSPAA